MVYGRGGGEFTRPAGGRAALAPGSEWPNSVEDSLQNILNNLVDEVEHERSLPHFHPERNSKKGLAFWCAVRYTGFRRQPKEMR